MNNYELVFYPKLKSFVLIKKFMDKKSSMYKSLIIFKSIDNFDVLENHERVFFEASDDETAKRVIILMIFEHGNRLGL